MTSLHSANIVGDRPVVIAATFLFVPGDRPEKYAKARASGADVVIIDLEDAVASAAKPAARDALSAYLSPAHPVAVRVNAIGTCWHEGDLAALGGAGVSAIIVPKAEVADGIGLIASRFPGIPILPLIETARGFAELRSIARCRGVQRLLFGTVDFQLDLGITDEGEALLFFRSALVFESRLAGIGAPVDGVSAALNAPDVLAREARRAKQIGFGGKLCIHPQQVAVVADCFQPSESDIAWAIRVVAAAEQSGGAAIALDGMMIDQPVAESARRLLGRVTSVPRQLK